MNKGCGIWVHHSRKRGENSGDLITIIYSEEVEITENPHHCNTAQVTKQRKLQDIPFVLQEITI